MTPAHLMARLPPLLVLSGFLNLATGHALPQPTKTVDYHEINAVPYPLAATAAPDDSFLLRRQFNTVCGYIGGDPALPATCSAGSHCVVDVDHGAVGCCPDGGSCTQGVFTGCVDADSGPQTEANPYVFTCRGSDSCYKNSFEGGFFQYGCGSTSGLATKVVATASGKTAIQLTSINAPLTASATSLSEPTTLGTRTRKSTTVSSTTKSSTTKSSTTKSSTTKTTETSSTESKTSSQSETSTESETETETASTASESADPSATDGDSASSSEASAPETDGDDNGSKNTGAIIGGTISGVAALAALVVLGIWLWKRKKGNTRQGPGVKQQVQHVGPPSKGNHNFAPVPPMHEVDDMPPPPPVPVTNQRSMNPIMEHDGPYAEPWDPPAGYGYSATAVGGAAQMEHDEIPLTRESDDFQHPYNSGLGRISEEDPRPGTAISTPGHMSSPLQAYPGPRRDGGGPLWQQNRGPGWI
ncbi:hypothetical protein NW762_001806 [Fusarium torreyae]|uniref:Mid2 domain-containing protein n=1 Tax=Fusarium torreyae TaxID=1237075 RepID=A0A9W8SEI8_9HYPO|nr:hypothetical protein NW762_001806 [Fusarium torreyae]